MAGRRIGQRAKHGPVDDRARRNTEDRTKLRARTTKPERYVGLSAKDEARMRAWERS